MKNGSWQLREHGAVVGGHRELSTMWMAGNRRNASRSTLGEAKWQECPHRTASLLSYEQCAVFGLRRHDVRGGG